MELFRLHAYSVTPRRTTDDDDSPSPQGGAVSINADLRAVIDDNIRAARFEQRIAVDFETDPATRNSMVRELLRDFAFGESATAKSAAQSLAEKLAMATDRRTAACLFIPAAMRSGTKRRVTLWTFPKDSAFQFRDGASGPTIEVMTDVFSQSSKLRKAALFEGRRSQADFVSGQVLDLQASHSSRDVADFWIRRLLECNLGIEDETGSRLLAKTVRTVYAKLADQADREQMHAAILSMRRSPQKRVSLKVFADRYLGGDLRDSFIDAAPNDRALNSLFDFKRDVFDETVKFRIFELSSGVFVSSPLDQVGRSVRLSGGERRRLRCEGEVVEEKVRSRHA